MTYARARLWLGITGVGTFVVLATFLLVSRLHLTILPNSEYWQVNDAWALVGFVGAFLILMVPFDLLGGFILPRRYQRQTTTFGQFLRAWLIGVVLQSGLFVTTGLVMLIAGRLSGTIGVAALITILILAYVAMQGVFIRLTTRGAVKDNTKRIHDLQKQLQQWNVPRKQIEILRHSDPGFTGGVVGLPGRESIVIPYNWLEELSPQQFAAAVARRLTAVDSNSRTYGLLLALGWILVGFMIATFLPDAGVTSIAQLVTTYCGFTIWTFLGLLILPSVSRQASYAIDSQVVQRGVPVELLDSTLSALDRLQDDEPQRSSFVETIFHPVPSVSNRRGLLTSNRSGAWHAARMVLFLSWSCLGLLSRAVHCNAGRPELWVMLPTD